MYYFLISTWVALVRLCWLCFGFFLAIEFSICDRKKMTITESKEVRFSNWVLHMFHRKLRVDLLVQHEDCCLKLENMEKTNHITHAGLGEGAPTCLETFIKVKILQHNIRKNGG